MGEIWKIIPKLSSNTHHICSSATVQKRTYLLSHDRLVCKWVLMGQNDCVCRNSSSEFDEAALPPHWEWQKPQNGDDHEFILILQQWCKAPPSIKSWHFSHLMTKPTKWLCTQQRLRSAWASQSDLSLHWAQSFCWCCHQTAHLSKSMFDHIYYLLIH